MSRANLCENVCPVARTVARVGDAWSLMVLRDAFLGRTRFAEFGWGNWWTPACSNAGAIASGRHATNMS